MCREGFIRRMTDGRGRGVRYANLVEQSTAPLQHCTQLLERTGGPLSGLWLPVCSFSEIHQSVPDEQEGGSGGGLGGEGWGRVRGSYGHRSDCVMDVRSSG